MVDSSQIQIQMGSKIGLSFNQGILKHDIYGDAGEVSGVVPLLLPYGTYKHPSILTEPERLNRLIKKMTPEYHSLWENEMDDEVGLKLKDFILFGACAHPLEDVETDRMQSLISVAILIFAIDDLCDQLSEGSTKTLKFTDIKKMTQFLVDVCDGAYSCLEEMPSPIKAIESTNGFIWKSKKMCEEFIPDFVANSKYVKQEWVNVLSSYVLFTEKLENGVGFSEGSRVLFGSYQAAILGYLEHVALLQNAKVSEAVRKHVLFRRMKVGVGSASNFMNDLFGLNRDIELDQVKDSFILSQVMDDGMELGEAWRKSFKNLCQTINDVRICIKYLRETMGEDKDLMEYINCTEIMLDGQLYWYQYANRYNNANLKIVQMSD